jgi:hypothetical protein
LSVSTITEDRIEQWVREHDLEGQFNLSDPKHRESIAVWIEQEDALGKLDIPPCPPWCVGPAGHPYDSVGYMDAGIAGERFHTTAQGGANVCVVESNCGNVVTLTAPEINTWVGGDGAAMDSTMAREFAAELLRVADEYDAIAAARR